MNLPLTEWVATHADEYGGVMLLWRGRNRVAFAWNDGEPTVWAAESFDATYHPIARTLPPPQRGTHESELVGRVELPEALDPTSPDGGVPTLDRLAALRAAQAWSRGLA